MIKKSRNHRSIVKDILRVFSTFERILLVLIPDVRQIEYTKKIVQILYLYNQVFRPPGYGPGTLDKVKKELVLRLFVYAERRRKNGNIYILPTIVFHRYRPCF